MCTQIHNSDTLARTYKHATHTPLQTRTEDLPRANTHEDNQPYQHNGDYNNDDNVHRWKATPVGEGEKVRQGERGKVYLALAAMED